MKHYIVSSKGDDYGGDRTELVRTTLKNAKEYYFYKDVADEDVDVLKKYMSFMDYEEEAERDDEQRFYGN